MKFTSCYPSLSVEATGTGVVSQAGSVLLLRTAAATGLSQELSAALLPWRKPLAQHDPGKIVLDLAVTLALGGDCLADIALLREQRSVFGPVASDPTVSRLIATLAADAPAVLRAIDTVRASARKAGWTHAGNHAPDHGIDAENPLIIDLDATLVTAHSEKQNAAPTYKRGFGFHPLLAFVDHGRCGTGEPVAALLRAGNAGSNTADDHITVVRDALAQLPFVTHHRVGRKVLIRTDGAGGTHAFLQYLTGRRLSYSVGFGLSDPMVAALGLVPDDAWTPAYDADGKVRDGAWVLDATGLLDLSGWPDGMRVIIRKERAHPGAQLRFTDADGLRLTAFVTNTRKGQLADLELRHRRRARCEDRIRHAKDTGLANLPLQGFDQNKDLGRDRWTCLGVDGLDTDACLHRPRRAAVGAETATAAPVFDRGTHRPSCPANPATAVCTCPLGRPDHGRDHQTRSATRADLTTTNRPDNRKNRTGPWNRQTTR